MRHRLLALLLAAVVARAQYSPPPPAPAVADQCAPPKVDVTINSTHVVLVLTFYSGASPGDPPGRGTFTFATFLAGDAHRALPWDPSMPTQNPATADAFSYMADAHAFYGMCDPAAASAWPMVANLTQWNESALGGVLSYGLTSPQMAGLTPQLAGCDCAAFSTGDGGYARARACDDPVVDDSPDSRVFYAASRAGASAWAVRQSTCPAAGACGSTSPNWAFQPAGASVACSLQTEAQLVLTLEEARALPGVTVVTDSTQVMLSWSVFTVEVDSTSPFGPQYVDSFTSRVLEHRYAVEYQTHGGVWTAFSPGGDLSSLLLRILSSSAMRVNATASTLTWSTMLYTRSPDELHNVTVSALAGADARVECAVTSLACALPDCGGVAQAAMPSFLTVALTIASNWVPYAMAASCTVDFPDMIASTASDWVLPTTTVAVGYGLSAGGVTITDTVAPPTVTFTTYLTVPGDTGVSETLTMTVRSVALSESSIAAAAGVSQVIEANAGGDAPTSVVYSQAVAVYVDLAVAAPTTWQLRPRLTVLVGTSSAPTPTPAFGALTGDAVLESSWCGLDRSDLLGAFVFVDAGAGGEMNDAPDVAAQLASPLYSEDLASHLAELLYGGNALPPGSVQGDIMRGGAEHRLYAVPDANGGFAVPMRNTFVSQLYDGFYLTMCMVVSATVVEPQTLAGWSPLFYTYAAAVANSMPGSDGSTHAPLRVSGVFDIDYFMPWSPVGGMPLCSPNLTYPGLPPGTSATCGVRRRNLLAAPSAQAFLPEVHTMHWRARTQEASVKRVHAWDSPGTESPASDPSVLHTSHETAEGGTTTATTHETTEGGTTTATTPTAQAIITDSVQTRMEVSDPERSSRAGSWALAAAAVCCTLLLLLAWAACSDQSDTQRVKRRGATRRMNL